MGSTLASFLESLDRAPANKKEAQQKLEVCKKLIETRFKLYENELNIGVGPVSKVPAKYLLSMSKIISANVSKGTQGNRNAIAEIVSQFITGEISKGVINVLFTALDIILGSHQGGYNQQQNYVVMTNLMGGLYRIDYLIVAQNLEATGITTLLQNVFGCYVIVSSINKKEFDDDNVYRILVEFQFAKMSMHQKFMVVKMLKGEDLTQKEMDAITAFKYDDLHFQGGQLAEPLRRDQKETTAELEIKLIKAQQQKKQLEKDIQTEQKDLKQKRTAVIQQNEQLIQKVNTLKKVNREIYRITTILPKKETTNQDLLEQNRQMIRQLSDLAHEEVENMNSRIDRLHITGEKSGGVAFQQTFLLGERQ